MSWVPACELSVHYYMGVSYLMLRRYQDAIRTLKTYLYSRDGSKLQTSKSYQQPILEKKTDHMVSLILMSLALSPKPLRKEDSLAGLSRGTEKEALWAAATHSTHSSDQLNQALEAAFQTSMPKFIPSSFPIQTASGDWQSSDVQAVQVDLFKQEVDRQSPVPVIRSFTKLYTAIGLEKLGSFIQCEDVQKLQSQLVCSKMKSRQCVWQSGPPLSGAFLTVSDVDFTMEGNIIKISTPPVFTNHAKNYLERITAFGGLFLQVERMRDPQKQSQEHRHEGHGHHNVHGPGGSHYMANMANARGDKGNSGGTHIGHGGGGSGNYAERAFNDHDRGFGGHGGQRHRPNQSRR
eukprot:Filipodium_phascolosomae@DN5596_c0_g1_i1.p1